MKKFVNDPKDFVPEMLSGIAKANPTLKYIPEYNLIMRRDIPRDDKVSIMQGSGSGHEPAHVMVVGKGLLDALVPAVDQLEIAFMEGKSTDEALDEAAVAARESAEATRPMLAKKGRAAYTGERSIGTLDAGAVAIAILFEAVCKAWKE